MLELSGGVALDETHDCSYAHGRGDGDQQMEVVWVVRIEVDGFEVNHGVVFAYLEELCFEVGKNSLIQPFVSVFCGNGHMVITVVHAVSQFNEFHASIVLSAKRILEATASFGLTPEVSSKVLLIDNILDNLIKNRLAKRESGQMVI